MRRIMYLWLPRWPIDRLRLLRRKSSAAPVDDAPFATVIDAAGRRLLAAINPAAAAAGLTAGMPLADALSFLPGLTTTLAQPEKDVAALRHLAEWCSRYSPWTAPDGIEGVRVEITGSAHLWGGETELGADLVTRLGHRGIAGRVAIADTIGAAWASARFAEARDSIVILPPGEQRAALTPLPVEALRLDPAIAQGLRRVGLKQIGDLCAMPRDALAQRFGEAVAQRLDQALGDMPEPLSPLGEAPSRRVRLSFAEPITEPADLMLATERLTAELVLRLAREGMGARRLDLGFHRIDGRVERIRLGTACPSRDPHHITRLFNEKLDTIDPGFGIEDMILGALAVEPLFPEQISFGQHFCSPSVIAASPSVISAKAGVQQRPAPHPGLLDPRFRGGDGAAFVVLGEDGMEGGIAPLLDRLGNRLGLDALSRLEPRESYIPERASVRVSPSPTQPPSVPSSASSGGLGCGLSPPSPALRERVPAPGSQSGGRRVRDFGKPLRPVRLFDPPQPVEAFWLLPDDPPFRFLWRRRRHRVVRADGPERIAEEWWLPGASGAPDAIRDYYRVEDEEGWRFWVFRTGLHGGARSPRWFIHGVFS